MKPKSCCTKQPKYLFRERTEFPLISAACILTLIRDKASSPDA
jgi:hypothetical protein